MTPLSTYHTVGPSFARVPTGKLFPITSSGGSLSCDPLWAAQWLHCCSPDGSETHRDRRFSVAFISHRSSLEQG